MVLTRKNTLAALFILIGIFSVVFAGIFVYQGFAKAKLIVNEMTSENITYTGAGGTISGIIDTPSEAAAMAAVLKEHRSVYGSYSAMKKDDPNRQTVLNAMTMGNSLDLAVLGFGVTDVVKASGGFMGLSGIIFIAIGVVLARSKPVRLE